MDKLLSAWKPGDRCGYKINIGYNHSIGLTVEEKLQGRATAPGGLSASVCKCFQRLLMSSRFSPGSFERYLMIYLQL